MSPLLVPLFAQLVSLGLGNRTEARYVDYEIEQFEGSTSPHAELAVRTRRADFSLGYGPTLTLQPLEKKPRELLVFHDASASAGYRFRHTRLTLASSLGLGETNFRLAALRGPGAPTMDAEGDTGSGGEEPSADPEQPGSEPTEPAAPTAAAPEVPDPSQPGSESGAEQLQIVDRVVRYYISSTTLGLAHEPMKDVSLSVQTGHYRAGGLDDVSRELYPELRGWFVGGSAGYTHRLTSRDAFASSASLVKTWSSTGSEAATLNGQEVWQHVIDSRTTTALGAGLNITRFSQDNGLRGFSVFPTFQAALAHQLTLWRGALSLTVFAYSTPALDPLRALVDPRVGVGGNLSYVRERFSLNLGGGSALSLAPEDHDTGAIDSAQADGSVAYRIAEMLEVDAGARYVRQAVQGVTVLPSSYAAYVGIELGYAVQLRGSRR